ncbi:protein KTI12 homolog isoform X2 [Cyprinodon tularosa]|uniref:protein KTI12 homolog isoform X2 n=1 Tax=Cyprinodon tularosa TaxID=77115 RepID=UPI0018E2386A|nr:protein KTI12 homolog isoform X2 [Cyprinodon tularosa]
MPLVVMCGYPCSGKTRRAEELKAHFEKSTDRQVYSVGDGALGLDRNSVYADSQKEKEARASLKAEVERKVNKDNIVILDSLNYIKGYRYELFCLTKHTQTPHCLVHCLTSGEESSLWNRNRESAEQYSQDIFDALVKRFEAPDSRNRWDSPLFTVLKDDVLPLDAISDALFKRKAPPPNQSTQSAIFNAQKTSVPGDLIPVPGATEKVALTRSVNMAELRKLRRQFISYSKMHPTENTSQIANMFVQYLNKGLH